MIHQLARTAGHPQLSRRGAGDVAFPTQTNDTSLLAYIDAWHNCLLQRALAGTYHSDWYVFDEFCLRLATHHTKIGQLANYLQNHAVRYPRHERLPQTLSLERLVHVLTNACENYQCIALLDHAPAYVHQITGDLQQAPRSFSNHPSSRPFNNRTPDPGSSTSNPQGSRPSTSTPNPQGARPFPPRTLDAGNRYPTTTRAPVRALETDVDTMATLVAALSTNPGEGTSSENRDTGPTDTGEGQPTSDPTSDPDFC